MHDLKYKRSNPELDRLFEETPQVASSYREKSLDPILQGIMDNVGDGRGLQREAGVISLKLVFPNTEYEAVGFRIKKSDPFKRMFPDILAKLVNHQRLKEDDLTLVLVITEV